MPRILWIVSVLLAIEVLLVSGDDELVVCSGFVLPSSSLVSTLPPSNFPGKPPLDMSVISVELFDNVVGASRESTKCAPNGYFSFGVYASEASRSVSIRIHAPDGWNVEPQSLDMDIRSCKDMEPFRVVGFTVSGGLGDGVEDVLVGIVDNDDVSVQETKTSSSGEFQFMNVLPGSYQLTFSHPVWKFERTSMKVDVSPETSPHFLGDHVVKRCGVVVSVECIPHVEFCEKLEFQYVVQGKDEILPARIEMKDKSAFIQVEDVPLASEGVVRVVETSGMMVIPPEIGVRVKSSGVIETERSGFVVAFACVNGKIQTIGDANRVEFYVDDKKHGIVELGSDGTFTLCGLETFSPHNIRAVDDVGVEYSLPKEVTVRPSEDGVLLNEVLVAVKVPVCGVVSGIPDTGLSIAAMSPSGNPLTAIRLTRDGEESEFCLHIPVTQSQDGDVWVSIEPLLAERDRSEGVVMYPKNVVLRYPAVPKHLVFSRISYTIHGGVLPVGSTGQVVIEEVGSEKKVGNVGIGKHVHFSVSGLSPGQEYVMSAHLSGLCFEGKQEYRSVVSIPYMSETEQNDDASLIVDVGVVSADGVQVLVFSTNDVKLSSSDFPGISFDIYGGKEGRMLCLPWIGMSEATKHDTRTYLFDISSDNLLFGSHHASKSTREISVELGLVFNGEIPVMELVATHRLLSGSVSIEKAAFTEGKENVCGKDGSLGIQICRDYGKEKGEDIVTCAAVETELESSADDIIVCKYSFWLPISYAGKVEILPVISNRQTLDAVARPELISLSVSSSTPLDVPNFVLVAAVYVKGHVEPHLEGVEVISIDGSLQSLTDSNGDFVIGPLPDADHKPELEARLEGWVFHPVEGKEGHFIGTELGVVCVSVEESVSSGSDIEGIVDVVDAVVLFSGTDSFGGHYERQERVTVGTPTCVNLPPGLCYIRAVSVEHNMSPGLVESVVIASERTEDVVFTASRTGYSISGTVMELNGNPIADLTVVVVTHGGSGGDVVVGTAISDSNGKYRIRGVSEGGVYGISVQSSSRKNLGRIAPKVFHTKMGASSLHDVDFVVLPTTLGESFIDGVVGGDSQKYRGKYSVEILNRDSGQVIASVRSSSLAGPAYAMKLPSGVNPRTLRVVSSDLPLTDFEVTVEDGLIGTAPEGGWNVNAEPSIAVQLRTSPEGQAATAVVGLLIMSACISLYYREWLWSTLQEYRKKVREERSVKSRRAKREKNSK